MLNTATLWSRMREFDSLHLLKFSRQFLAGTTMPQRLSVCLLVGGLA